MFLIISLALAGISLCLLVYVALSPGFRDTIPQMNNKRFSWLVWLWPWVMSLSHLVMPFLTWKFQKKLDKQLRQAGYYDVLQVKDIAGLQALGAIVGGVTMALLGYFFETEWWLRGILCVFGCVIGTCWPLSFLARKIRERHTLILKGFPFFLDMVTLCVEAGSNLQTALIMAAQSLSDGPLRTELRYALNEMRTGKNRLDALKAMAERCGVVEIKQWVGSVSQAELLGSRLGPTLKAQSEQFRQERFLRAEKKAAETPVKMLFPLVLFIFPCTFIVIAYPIVFKISQMDFF